jgi:acetylornithine/succinyldiaminopimelate/putrescine aminotransferase
MAASAVIATINTFLEENVIRNCAEVGKYLYNGLTALKKKFPFVVDIRGMGLIWGIEVTVNGDEIVKEFLKEGVILNCTKGKILRLTPPLVVKKEEIDIFLEMASRIFERIKT